jgi:transposase
MASFLGIDLSKETFHASLLDDHAEAKKVFPNTSKGFEQLTAWLKNRHVADVHICMEATGAYWEALASYLDGLEQRVSVINPARIKAFAQSELLRTKTDEDLRSEPHGPICYGHLLINNHYLSWQLTYLTGQGSKT